MSWAKTSKGHYQRPCDPTERTFETIAKAGAPHNREHWSINVIAQIEPNGPKDIYQDVQRAWRLLRHQHPSVAVVLEASTFHYQVPDDTELEKWMSDSCFLEPGSASEFLLSTRARARAYASLHYFSHTNEIILRLHHWLLGGLGSIHLLNSLLRNIATDAKAPSFGDEWSRLSPSLTEVAGLQVQTTPEDDKVASEMIQSFLAGQPPIGLELSPNLTEVGGTQHCRIEVPQKLTEQIVEACRKRDLTVGAAIQAAVIVATQELKTPFEFAKHYTSFAPFDYRSYISGAYSSLDDWPLGCYIMNMPFSVPEGDFTTQAERMKKHFQQSLRKGETPYFNAYNAFAEKLNQLISTPPPPGLPPPSVPQLSNLGKLEARVRREYDGPNSFQLRDCEVVVDQMLTSTLIYQWSFRDSLFISANYNEKFYGKETMPRFLETVRNILIKELEVVERHVD